MNAEKQNQAPKAAANPAMAFWRERGQDLIKDSIKSTEEAAKQLIGVDGVLEGLYFHAVTYSGLRGKLTPLEIGLYVLPLVLWLASLAFALLVYFPRRYSTNISSWEESKATFGDIADQKYAWLRLSALCLALGLLALAPVLVLYLK